VADVKDTYHSAKRLQFEHLFSRHLSASTNPYPVHDAFRSIVCARSGREGGGREGGGREGRREGGRREGGWG
jgi:hypothetical protein